MTIFEQLIEDFGLELILEQNSIEQSEVLSILFDKGLIDLDDYTFEELEIDD